MANTVTVDTTKAEPRALDPTLRKIRASILLAGPMLARFGRVSLPPGGDVIVVGAWTRISSPRALGADIRWHT